MNRTEDPVNFRAKAVLTFAFGTSLAVHGVAYASLASRPLDTPSPAPVSTVSFEVSTPSPPVREAAPSVPEVPTHQSAVPTPARAPSPKAALASPSSPPASTPPSASPALDLSGVTLTNDTGAGFAMPVGDGSTLHGPLGQGGPRAGAGTAPSRTARGVSGPTLVALRDLSEHPRPPALEGLLRANYPEEARLRGLRGTASVRARIDADGVIRSARVVTESSSGFGPACQRTVAGSRWSAPRAQNGDAVATEIVYTCHFEVD